MIYGGFGGYSPRVIYVKKENAVGYIDKQFKALAIILTVFPVIFLLIQGLVFYFLTGPTIRKPIPIGTIFELCIFTISIAAGLKLFFTNRDYSALKIKLNKYKDGEIIKVKDLNQGLEFNKMLISFFVILIFVIAGACWGLMSAILAIV